MTQEFQLHMANKFEPYHLWIGPLRICMMFGYDKQNRMHKFVTCVEDTEGWQRPIVVHICTPDSLPAGMSEGIYRSRFKAEMIYHLN